MTLIAKGLYVGQPVVFAKKLERQYDAHDQVHWVETDCEMQRGIVSGLRSLQEGYISDGYGAVFVQTRRVPCVLVVTDIYQSPVQVPIGAAISPELIDEQVDEGSTADSLVFNLPA